MIKVTVIASSSLGNCYTIDDGNSRLMLECGIPWKRIQKALGFQASGLDGCLVSHEHLDHIKAGKDLIKSGIELYVSKGTAKAIGLTGHRVHRVKALQRFNIKDWTILPFDTIHDSVEPLGFLIQNKAEGKLLFMTDSSFCKYRFKGINYLMIECNFSNRILEENIQSGRVNQARKKRLVESHFSLERLKDFLGKNDLSRLMSIHLMHLSNENSDDGLFKAEIQQLTGVPVYVCSA